MTSIGFYRPIGPQSLQAVMHQSDMRVPQVLKFLAVNRSRYDSMYLRRAKCLISLLNLCNPTARGGAIRKKQ